MKNLSVFYIPVLLNSLFRFILKDLRIRKNIFLLFILTILLETNVFSQVTNYNSKEMFLLGNQYYQEKNYFSAAEVYRKILTKFPKKLEVRYNLAQTYYHIYKSQKLKGYLSLTVYTYEQLLEQGLSKNFLKENLFIKDKVDSLNPVKNNLTQIRIVDNLNTVPRSTIAKTLIEMRIYQDFILHSLGIAFVFLSVFFALILLGKKSHVPLPAQKNTHSAPISFKKKVFTKLINRFQSSKKKIFLISLILYLFLLVIFLSSETYLSTLNHLFGGLVKLRGVVSQETAMRKFPRADAYPFALISEGETIIIKEKNTIPQQERKENQNWVNIETSSGIIGWVNDDHLLIIHPWDLPTVKKE